LRTNLNVVDKTLSEHEFYRYGKDAVMRLDLICEYQFNRMGYDAIKPEPVKSRLGQVGEATGDTSSETYPDMNPGGMFPGGMGSEGKFPGEM
jgi:hypothetical protein